MEQGGLGLVRRVHRHGGGRPAGPAMPVLQPARDPSEWYAAGAGDRVERVSWYAPELWGRSRSKQRLPAGLLIWRHLRHRATKPRSRSPSLTSCLLLSPGAFSWPSRLITPAFPIGIVTAS